MGQMPLPPLPKDDAQLDEFFDDLMQSATQPLVARHRMIAELAQFVRPEISAQARALADKLEAKD